MTTTAPPETAGGRRHLADAADLTVVSQTWLTDRLIEARVATPYLDQPVGLRILVPVGHDPTSGHRPRLGLFLHGGLGGFRDWVDHGALDILTRDMDLLAVMPSGGTGGWYRDWQNFGRGGNPRWETFHLACLLPWIDTQFPTRTDPAGRIIAGVSMGGYGALSYAARHPGMFGAAASFSGAVDLGVPLVAALVGVSPLAHRRPPLAIHGIPLTSTGSWRDHNPRHLAAALAGIDVTITCGDGRPTRLHTPRDRRPRDLQEHQVRLMNLRMHQRLTERGISHRFIDYGNVGHDWANWSHAAQAWLDTLDLT